MPLISAIVPVYQSETHLSKCIESISAQTIRDCEIIIVDDGSFDCGGALCDEWISKDERVIVIHQRNSGQGSARNNAISISAGDWITFVDSDDMIHENMLELLYRSAKETRVGLCCCNYLEAVQTPGDFWNRISSTIDISQITVRNEKDVLALIKSNYYWTIWAKLIKREIVYEKLFPDGRFYEDNAIAGQWIICSKSIAVIDYPLYFYRITEGSTTNSSFSVKSLDWLWALEEQMKYYNSLKFYTVLDYMFHQYF